ncbi:MAG: ABC transporter permease [Thermomicrobiales bacterium]|nr:ABC transporter permease [Thermomicrobiales bacterium]MCO5223043.1 ABC transporter permease [Thermomicrobiales bacterium]
MSANPIRIDRSTPTAPQTSLWSRRLRMFLRDWGAVLGCIVIAVMVVLAVLAPVLRFADPLSMNPLSPVQPPSWSHPLGTDSFGRDILARLIWGGRISLAVAATTVLVSGVIGTLIGLVAGYAGGAVDSFLMRIMDALFTFPSILLAVALMGVLGPSLLSVVVALVIVYIPSFARQARAETRIVRRMDYMTAGIALGAQPHRLLLRHVLPNISATLLIRGTTFFAFTIVAESSLSFLGIGVQPPTPTWGGMLAEARPYIATKLWYPLMPGMAIVLCVISINLISDALLDLIGPSK